MEWTLPARQPFSLPAVVRSHGWIRLAPFSDDEDGAAFRYVTRLDTGEIVELNISGAADGVSVSVDGQLSMAEQDEVSQQVGWMLGLDQDLSDFYDAVRAEPCLAHVIELVHRRSKLRARKKTFAGRSARRRIK